MSNEPQNRGRYTLPDDVRRIEREYIHDRRIAANKNETEPARIKEQDPLVGLALSGGGIRSATFCLGILQVLARRNALRMVDYLSTVSGGGYIGSCLSSLMTVRKNDLPRLNQQPSQWTKTRFDLGENMPLARPHQVHHLRKHGDFLIARKGLFGRETLRAVGTYLLGLVCSLGMGLVALLLLVGLWFLIGWMLGGAPLWTTVHESHWPGWRQVVNLASPTTAAALRVFAVGVAVAAVFALFAFCWPEKAGHAKGETPEEKAARRWLWFFVFSLSAAVVGLSGYGALSTTSGERSEVDKALWRFEETTAECEEAEVSEPTTEIRDDSIPSANDPKDLSLRPDASTAPRFPYLLLPAVGFAGALVALWIVYVLFALFARPYVWNIRRRSQFGAMQGICFHLLFVSGVSVALIAALWWYRCLDVGEMTGGMIAVVSFLLTRLFARENTDPRQRKSLFLKLVAAAPRFLLPVVVLLFLVSAFVCCATFMIRQEQYLDVTLILFPYSAIAFVFLGFLVDFNRISPHYFYRDRLAEAYLQTEARVQPQGEDRGTLERVRDDYALTLRDLHESHDEAGEVRDNCSPYHLILCALNLPGSRDLDRKDRKSDHFIFSRYFCGSRTTGYVPTCRYRNGTTKLCTALTISGAAVSSSMGFITSFAKAFATTLFNIRVGYWLDHPNRNGVAVFESAGASDDQTSLKKTSELSCAAGLARWLADSTPIFWPVYLFRELTASTNANLRLVNLSDGGHTGDNIGLYPLLQRRCRLIIVCDGECDPEYTFSSLANAIRQIYIDENVGVDMDIDQLRPKEKNREEDDANDSPEKPQRHFLVGRITYPTRCDDGEPIRHPLPGDPLYGESKSTEGWIIYLKSSFLDRDEAATVMSYAAYHDDFPHETTADQFFDDDQFEAYRALGAIIARQAFDSAGIDNLSTSGEPKSITARLIKWCEGEWNHRASFDPGGEPPAGPGNEPPVHPGGDPPTDPSNDPALDLGGDPPADLSNDPAVDPEEGIIRDALVANDWIQKAAAKQLGFSPTTLRRRMKKFSIEKPPED